LLAIALLAAGGACGSRTLIVPSHVDAATKTQDGSPNVDAAPTSQPATVGQCPDGYAPCGKGDGLRCFDLSRSQDHCGACENGCPSGIACQAGTCQQYRCKGALSFKTLVFGPFGVITALGDFDGDGILDLVGETDPDINSPMRLLYGAGDGTFLTGPVIDQVSDWTVPDSGLPYAVMNVDWQALAADLDEDGRMDLITIRAGDSAVRVRLGLGGRATPFGQPTSYPTNDGTASMVLADFDTDGRLDLVVGASQGFEYWRGQGGGRFEHQAVLDSPGASPFGPGMAMAVDWNGDGVLDLVYGMGGTTGAIMLGWGGQLRYRLGHGDGSFDAEVVCALTAGMVGDLDHDKRPDLISSSSIMGSTLLLGIDGCSASKIVPITDWTKEGGVALADFNGDGNLDVIVDDNLAIVVHVGDGQCGFPHALTLPAPTADQWPDGSFLVGDLNRDGKLDVVFARDGVWGVLLNTCQ
jgi:hypothetical protein